MSDDLEDRIKRIEDTLGTLIAWQFGIVLGSDAINELLNMLKGIRGGGDDQGSGM